MHKNIPSFQVI